MTTMMSKVKVEPFDSGRAHVRALSLAEVATQSWHSRGSGKAVLR